MALVAAAIMPHGFPLIPAVSEDADGAMRTRRSLESVGRVFRDAGVEAIVLAGPHGTRVDGFMAIVRTGRAAGSLSWNGSTVEMNVPCDIPLAEAIASEAANHSVPCAFVGFAGNRDGQAVMPMDWGAMVPLWFTGHDRNLVGHGSALSDTPDDEGRPPVVLITPSRKLPRTMMQTFGEAVATAIQADSRRIGFIASCDWAHAHHEDGPYGADPAARPVDDAVLDAVTSNRLSKLLDLSDDDVQHAAIDGMWQTLILDGVQRVVPMDVTFHSYEVPSYYSMIVASYLPRSSA